MVSQHTLQVSRPTPGGKLRGLVGGLQAHGQLSLQAHTQGGLQTHTWGGSPGPHPGWGCIPACTEADPPPRRLLLRAVRILLESILLKFFFEKWKVCLKLNSSTAENALYKPMCTAGIHFHHLRAAVYQLPDCIGKRTRCVHWIRCHGSQFNALFIHGRSGLV